MKTETIMIDELVSPLIELFNRQYPIPGEEYEIPPFGQFGVLEESPNEVAVELPDAIVSNQLATRAIATLLQKSASHSLRTGSEVIEIIETDPYRTPLRCALLKRSFWLDDHWQWNRYLIIDYLCYGIDAQAAEQQIKLLTNYVRQPSNLVELGPDGLAMF